MTVRIRRALATVLAILLCLPLFSACGRQKEAHSHTVFHYFDTFCTLTAYTENQADFNYYITVFEETLKEYHELLDIYHTYEGVVNLKTINDGAGGEAISVDPRLGAFLRFGKTAYEKTEGYTNIAMGSVLSLWHDARARATEAPEAATLPSPTAITEAMAHTDMNDLILSDDNTAVRLLDPQMSLDAGAVGKGYAANEVARALREAGCDAFLVNLGGNLLSHGEKPKGEDWLAGIDTPEGKQGFEKSVRLPSLSLVTSGSSQRFFTVNGKVYHHIIDPHTGYPETRYFSVSVLCADSALADALSTALFCMSEEDGKRILSGVDGAEAIWIFADGSYHTTDCFFEYVE